MFCKKVLKDASIVSLLPSPRFFLSEYSFAEVFAVVSVTEWCTFCVVCQNRLREQRDSDVNQRSRDAR